jgi:hypothetical protein
MAKEEIVHTPEDTPPIKPGEEMPQAETEGKLPENFKSVDDLVKALNDTKAELTRLQQGKTKEEANLKITTDQAKAEIEKAGFDWDKLVVEFEDKGTLSEETFKELEKKGVPKAQAEQFMQGQVALAEKFANDIKTELAIPADEYAAMLEWAGANLSDADKVSFNRQVSQMTDPSGVKRAIRGLQAEYTAAVGKQPKLVTGNGSRVTTDKSGFQSWAQVTAAMGDPRYQKDEAYRQEVQDRLAMSNL